MTKALYIHGFGSSFRPNSPKMSALASKFELVGVNVDYTKGYNDVASNVLEVVSEHNIDLLVGTSMGGYTAQRIGAWLGIIWISINPVIDPYKTLVDRVSEEVLQTYKSPAKFEGAGMVILDMADEVLDNKATLSVLPDTCDVKMFEGGNHQFAHMDEAVHDIEHFYNRVFASYA